MILWALILLRSVWLSGRERNVVLSVTVVHRLGESIIFKRVKITQEMKS